MAESRPYFLLEPKGELLSKDILRSNYQAQIKGFDTEISCLEDEMGNGENDREIKDKAIELHKVSSKKEACEKQLKLLEEHDDYVLLYTLKDKAKEDENITTGLDDNDGDKLLLSITFESPSKIKLEVVDGKIYFSPENMTAEEMKDMLVFMERHDFVGNLSELKIENANDDIKETFSQAVEKCNEYNKGEENIFFSGVNNEDASCVNNGEDYEYNLEAPKETLGEGSTQNYGLFGGIPANNNAKGSTESVPLNPHAECNKSLRKWMNKNKSEGLSWFPGSSDGWDTFTCYSGENPRQNHDPVTIDPKTKEIKCKYEFKVYTRMRNGKLEVCFSLPPGKNLTDDQAYMITSALKDAGIKYVEFGSDMTDPNDGVMRTACAKRLLVPVGHKINAERYDKMIEAAGQKVGSNSPELFRYKYDLAMQMDKLLRAKGIDYTDVSNKNNPDCRAIRWAVGAYQLHPFRDLWEDFGLRGDYEKRLSEGTPSDPKCIDSNNGAKKVIGAKLAVGSLYEMFSENTDNDVGYLLSKGNRSLNEQEKSALQQYVLETGLPTDTKVRDMPSAALRMIYAEMCKTQENKVQKDIEKEYFEILRINKQNGSKDDPEKGAVKEIFARADTYIQDMNEQLKDCNLPPIFLARKAMPKHNFAHAREEAIAQGLVRLPAPGNTGNNYNRRNGGRN